MQDYSDCDPTLPQTGKEGPYLSASCYFKSPPTPPPGKKVYTCLLNVLQQDFSPDLGHCRALSQVCAKVCSAHLVFEKQYTNPVLTTLFQYTREVHHTGILW